jgi:hypothetical protein
MTDRPVASILAALAAAMFVAAFSAAAVTRSDSVDPSAGAAARPAPAAAQENSRVETLAAPAFSRVAALPALHLPKARKPAKPRKPAAKPEPAPPAAAPPAATAAPPVRSAPAAPPAPKRRSNVGKTFDTSG